MFGPRSPRYPMLSAYVATRPRSMASKTAERPGLAVVASSGAILAVASTLVHEPVLFPLGLALAGAFGFLALRAKPSPPPTPEQALAQEAESVLRRIAPAVSSGKLHRAFHPAVAATLEECATYHARIVAALDEGRWESRDDLRTSALAAAKVAMDEAIVAAGRTLPYVSEPRPLDAVSDALEDVGFGPLTRPRTEPMPPGFRPVRELAEGLRELAVRCETAAIGRREESPEAISPAFRHLDAALGEMRRLEEAEAELRQGA